MLSWTSTAACLLGYAFQAACWPRRSARGPAPRSSRSATGSPPSTPTRPRSTTRWPPTRPSCGAAPPRRHRFRGRVRRRRARRRHPGQRPRHGLPLPAAALVMSPYADLTLARTTMDAEREADPLLSREALQARVSDYTAGHDPALGLISPVFADLSGRPPLIIQAGTHEVLLDDAVRLARQAAIADVAGHPRHHPRSTACLPGLLPDPRRSSRRPGPSRTTPLGPSRQRTDDWRAGAVE